MRPRTLDEFVGQEQILGPDALLRRAIERDELRSAIFWGPPGCGKSTLALVIAAHTRAHFETFSAVTSGVAEVRRAIEAARTRRRSGGRRTILFVDEIHRFNKAQQDAFLPHVEDGTIILIGATTENPYFSVNTPLLSRARIFRFEALDDAAVRAIVRRALADADRGLASGGVELDPAAEEHLVGIANGDARGALNTLEMAALSVEPDESGRRHVALAVVEEAAQQRVLGYDKSGDSHYDAVSAFIKSMRGSDPDAAVYRLARMIQAGEDPRFIARRMVIHAAEDVGMADPTALLVATAAAHAVEYVGLPEAQIPMTQAALYIATAPKSNAVVTAMHRANADVAERRADPVPTHLRDTSYPGARQLGHGKGYLYPHDYPGHHVPQRYVPEGAQSQPYYQPSDQGYEQEIARRLTTWQAPSDPSDLSDPSDPSDPSDCPTPNAQRPTPNTQ